MKSATGIHNCTALFLTACLFLAACGSSGDPPVCVWPADVPDGNAIYVCATAGGGGDGSQGNPFGELAAAQSAAADGDIIAIAKGDYEGSMTLSGKSVSVVGAGSTDTTIHSESTLLATLAIYGAIDTQVSGLSLTGNGGLGLLLHQCENVVVEDVVATGYQQGEEDAEGNAYYGIGLYVADSINVTMTGLTAVSNRVYGIAVAGSTGQLTGSIVSNNGTDALSAGVTITDESDFSVGDPTVDAKGLQPATDDEALTKGGCVVSDNKGKGIFVTDAKGIIIWSIVAGNESGGITLKDAALPGANGERDDIEYPGAMRSEIRNSLIHDNFLFGISAYGGNTLINENLVQGVRAAKDVENPDQSQVIAHGISVTTSEGRPAEVEMDDNDVEDCDGAGVLIDGVSTHALSTNEGGDELVDQDVVSIIIHMRVKDTKKAGVWVQGQSLVDVLDCHVENTALAGIAFTKNSRGLVQGNNIVSVVMGSKYEFEQHPSNIEMGDGIFLHALNAMSSVRVYENQVLSADRNGMIIDASQAWAFYFPDPAGGTKMHNHFGGNVVDDNAVPDNEDEGVGFAVQESCYGFDQEKIDTFQSHGKVEDLETQTLKDAPSIGSFLFDTSFPTATGDMASGG